MIHLKELTRDDIPTINKWRQDQEVSAGLGGPFRFIGIETEYAWFENYLKNRNTQVRCCVWDDDKLVGLISLTSIDYVSRSCEAHILIGDEEGRKSGVGIVASELMAEHTFFNMNLRRATITVLEENTAAIKLNEYLGYVREGVLRQSVYKQGEYKNQIIMGLLREDYMARRDV